MKPTNGMDRGQFHDKAWALWQAKALDDAKLPKLSIYSIRTLWDVLFDSMPDESKVAQPVEQTRALTDLESLAKRFLLEEDFAALFVFNGQCEDFEADGYTASSETMERLSELGVIRRLSPRGKRYGVTAFGSWLIETEFSQNPGLPLRTVAEHNERESRGHSLYLKESAPHSTAWVELPRTERESWRRKAMTAAHLASGETE